MAESTVLQQSKDTEIQHLQEVSKENDSDIEYCYLWVKDPGTKGIVLVYVDTSIQDILYDPITFQHNYKSNLSVVMKFENVGDPKLNVYTISNVVLPNNGLIQGPKVEDGAVYSLNIILDEAVQFIQLPDPNDSKKCALYTLIDKKIAYLLPVVDPDLPGHRSKIIRIVQGDPSPKDKYVFEKEVISEYKQTHSVKGVDKTTQTEDISVSEARVNEGCCLIL